MSGPGCPGRSGGGVRAPDPHVPHYGAAEMARRLAASQALAAHHGVDALLVYGAGRFALDLYWISDWPGGREGLALVPREGPATLFVQFYNHVPQARRMCAWDDVRWAGEASASAVCEALSGLRPTGRPLNLGVAGPLPHRIAATLTAALPGLRITDLSRPLAMLRAIKSDEEVARIRLACALTDRSLEALYAALAPGVRERDLVRALEDTYLAAGGYTGIHFLSSMPMDGPTAYVPSQYPSERAIRVGDVVIGEYTGCYWGASGQIHRTFSLGREPTPAWRRLHAVAVEAYEAIAGALCDGARARDILTAADVIAARGLGVCDDLLHGVDQLPPVLRTRQSAHGPQDLDFTFREGMVVTIQPNPVDPVAGMGLQFGETVQVTRTGVERLHGLEPAWRVRPV